MISYLLSGPAGEPISLAEAKAFLRLDGEAEDALVTTLIAAARLHVEGVTGRALLQQSWRLVMDAWPADGVVRLPVAPLSALSAITLFDDEGEPTELNLAGVESEPGVGPARLVLPPGFGAGVSRRARNGIEIDYVAGYGADGDAVPADLKHALLALVAHWFENRDAVIVAGSGSVVPTGFDRLMQPYRRVGL